MVACHPRGACGRVRRRGAALPRPGGAV